MKKEYIEKIYELAVDSFNNNEIPVGAIVVKNDKIYINTIKNTISMMNKAGVGARTSEKEDENYIRFTVEIKK